MTIPLVIDTDVALGVRHEGRPRDIDDGFAIVEAINLDVLDLRAITTVYGNAPHHEVNRVANLFHGGLRVGELRKCCGETVAGHW